MENEQEWGNGFTRTGAYWKHDRNPLRPYALLSSGLISDGFFNGGRVIEEDPELFGLACRELWNRATLRGYTFGVTRVLGAALGGISLSSRIAEVGRIKSGFAEKKGDDFSLNRPLIIKGERFLLVEDTVTTGGTLEKLHAETCKQVERAEFASAILALCNRSGKVSIAGMPIISLISPSMRSWERGENPCTPDGNELVEPVHPKTHWDELTREYPNH